MHTRKIRRLQHKYKHKTKLLVTLGQRWVGGVPGILALRDGIVGSHGLIYCMCQISGKRKLDGAPPDCRVLHVPPSLVEALGEWTLLSHSQQWLGLPPWVEYLRPLSRGLGAGDRSAQTFHMNIWF